jgi:predicted 3-demethylubiquinone-9 3-methyltransferase (glyoxalase superfamily)
MHEQCGLVRDKYGVSWQVVPVTLGQMLEMVILKNQKWS